MRAIYKNRIYNVVDVSGDITLNGRDVPPFRVEFHDAELIVDPTDDDVANAVNLAHWYGLNLQRTKELRRMLLREISVAEWQETTRES
jgi:hypothetical protein